MSDTESENFVWVFTFKTTWVGSDDPVHETMAVVSRDHSLHEQADRERALDYLNERYGVVVEPRCRLKYIHRRGE